MQTGQWDVRGALKDLLNLKEPESLFYGKDTSTDAFISRYGALREMPALEEMMRQMLNIKDDNTQHDARHAVRMARTLFCSMWHAHDKGSNAQQQQLFNGCLAAVFGPAQIDGEYRNAGLQVDILAGTIEPQPRDLLDALGLEFMRSYRMIGRCERCRRFFFKSYPTDRYCSRPCGDAARTEAQRNWMREKRAEEKRKKEARKPKAKRRIQ
jgi:hypothetical protein